MQITLRQDHFDRAHELREVGYRSSDGWSATSECAGALAIREQCPGVPVYVGYDTALVDGTAYFVPEHITTLIREFIDRKPLSVELPQTFELTSLRASRE